MPGEPFHIVGLKELQRDLRAVSADLPKELRKANLDVAKIVEAEAKQRASDFGGVRAKAAPAIKGQAEQRRAKIVVDGNKVPFALGAFYGAKQYKQFPDWVGNSWDAGGPGGPYAINAAIHDKEDEIVDAYAGIADRLFGLVE